MTVWMAGWDRWMGTVKSLYVVGGEFRLSAGSIGEARSVDNWWERHVT